MTRGPYQPPVDYDESEGVEELVAHRFPIGCWLVALAFAVAITGAVYLARWW